MKTEDLLKISKSLKDDCRILPEGEYLESAVFMPFVEIDGELELLFEKRAKHIRQGGEISFPGGQIDHADADPLDTAVRETIEELGVEEESINITGKLGTLVSPRGVIVHTYLGILNIDDIEKIKFDKNEVEKIFTVPLSFFREHEPDIYKLRTEIKPYAYDKDGNKVDLFPAEKLNLPKRYHGKWSITEHSVLVYPTKGEVVWGLTARLIYEFIKLL